MSSAIDEIFYGSFGIGDRETSEECAKAGAALNETEKEFLNYIQTNGAAIEIFERYKDAYDELCCAKVLDYYKAGFRDGFRLALDAADGKK